MKAEQALGRHVQALTEVFRSCRDKHEAHRRARAVLADMAGDDSLVGEILRRHLMTRDTLGWRHYPVLGIELEQNSYFTLVANCWIPLPGGATDVSTKSIHHHGNMLLSTTTCFGPGYEHWTFTRPELVDPENDLYSMRLIGHEPHPREHVAFVDAFIPHCPLYPGSLTITLALWSNQFPTSWRDVLKRLPMMRGREEMLRQLAARVGLTRALDLKVVEYFDFYPTPGGFRGMKERIEFPMGPNEDYLCSLFHTVQATGNDDLCPVIEAKLAQETSVGNRELATSLLDDLKRGRPVEGHLSRGHYAVLHANFRRDEIQRALDAAPAPEAAPS